jgi:hypothetical protein
MGEKERLNIRGKINIKNGGDKESLRMRRRKD